MVAAIQETPVVAIEPARIPREAFELWRMCSTDGNRFSILRLHIQRADASAKVVAVATDGHQMATYTWIDRALWCELEQPIQVERDTAKDLCKQLKKFEREQCALTGAALLDKEVRVGGNTTEIVTGSDRVGNFPNFEQVIPPRAVDRKPAPCVGVDLQFLANAYDLLAAMAPKEPACVELYLGDHNAPIRLEASLPNGIYVGVVMPVRTK